MIKTLLVLVNIVGLTILNFLFLQKIDVAHNPPETLTPGSSEEVEVVISKGSVEGFAKFQLNVDNGLRIEAIESRGASFTFNDQKAKFIWMSLPEEKEIVIRYRLLMDSNADGDKNIDGHFSYIDDNQRLVHDIARRVVSTGIIATASEESEPQATDQNFQASATRSIEPGTDGRMLVELRISKGALTGFAKIQEEISTDYTAVAVESNDAVFNIVDNTVKFVWFDIPADEFFTVSYELIPVIDNPNVEFPIQGEFSYLVNNGTQTVEIGEISSSTSIAGTDQPEEDQEEQLIAENEGPEEPVEEDDEPIIEVDEGENWETDNLNNGERSAEEGTEKQEPVKEVKEQPVAEEPEEKEDRASEPVTSIAYRVQITAANKVVDKEYFKNMHKYSGGFDIEHHQGWIKYTTGGFAVYRAARDYRDELMRSYDFPGPFVTAYNEGERITVQEALMIANQKWVP